MERFLAKVVVRSDGESRIKEGGAGVPDGRKNDRSNPWLHGGHLNPYPQI
jgi:hypothetical protein